MALTGATNPFGKDTWLPPCVNQLENALGKMFEIVDTEPDWRIEGRNIYGKVETGDSLGQGVTPEGGNFPVGSDPTYAEFKLAMSRLSHTAELTYDEFELLNSNDAGAVPIVQRKLTKAVDKMQRDTVRQMWMSGDARLARTTDTAPGLTITLSAANGDAGSANQIDRDRFNWIAPNRTRIDIVDATTGNAIANGTGRTVVGVSGNVVTLDTAGGNVDPTANTVVVWTGSVAGGGTYVSREFQGILAAVAENNNYLSRDRSLAANVDWKATVVTGATPGTNELPSLDRALSLINRMANAAEDGSQPGPETHMACSNFGVQAALVQYLAPGIRLTTDRASFDMAPQGFQGSGIPFLNMPYWADVHAPRNNLLCLARKGPGAFKFVRAKRSLWGMLDFMPGIIQGIWMPVPGTAAGTWSSKAQAILTGLVGLMTHRPASHGRLDDIRELGT